MANAENIQQNNYEPTTIPQVRTVYKSAPFMWLKQGVSDFVSTPLLSSSIGLVFTLLTAGIAYASMNQPKLTLAFLTALLIVGPFLAAGLYRIAKLNRQGKTISMRDSLMLFTRNKGRIAVFVLMLLLVTLAWIRISSLMVALYYGQLLPDIGVISGSLGSADSLRIIGPLVAVSALFGFLLFAVSALSLPMIVNQKAETIPALIASLKTVVKQPGTMLIWAGLIATLSLIGVATLLIGLIFIFPVLGYATWHSYQDMVK